MSDPQLEKLQRQYEQAKARLQAARARKAEHDRKLDARRKIILGGALVEKAGRDTEASRLLMSLVAGLSRVQDRKAFEGWSPPVPEAEGQDGRKAEQDADADSGSGMGEALPRDAGTADQRRQPDTEAQGLPDPDKGSQIERQP